MAFNKSDILSIAEEEKIKSILLQFTDITGIIKNVAIPLSQLDKALSEGIMFDGSSIEGFVRIEESDMLLVPDPETFIIFPETVYKNKTARLICDVHNPDGTAFAGCPRLMLKRIIQEANDMGYSRMNAGPEAEFFLFPLDEKGIPTTQTHDHGGYFDLSPVDKGEDARQDIVEVLQHIGFEVEASHHEVAHGQHEIDFKYADALKTADNIITFRAIVRIIANSHGLHATFMPKPIHGINGSGMHTHQSLYKDGKNCFAAPEGTYGLSEDAIYYLGGLLRHVKGFTAITNPLVNSYKRLVPGYEAPVYIAWSERNRSPLVRLPAARGEETRLEVRSPDPSCNPYLALGVMLKSGLDGIKNKIMPPEPVNLNIYAMTAEERLQHKIDSLPVNIYEAIKELSKNELIKGALGEHIYQSFISARLSEWYIYQQQVHSWEINQYLSVF